MDIAGFWERVDYADHFEHFALRRYDHKLVYEMALKVYDDTYDHDDPEASRVQLTPDKIMGFTMAYCDNDDKEAYPPKREKFYGSVWVPEYAYNSHWENADYFGTMKLIDETGTVSVDEQMASAIPGTFRLLQNYPNPFNPATVIRFELSESAQVRLAVFDVLGRHITTLVNETRQAGIHEVNFDASHLAGGTYIYRIEAGEFVESGQMLFLK